MLLTSMHVRLQLDAKRLEGDVEYTETDEEEKGINFAQLVADRQIALSECPSPRCKSQPLLYAPAASQSTGGCAYACMLAHASRSIASVICSSCSEHRVLLPACRGDEAAGAQAAQGRVRGA